MVYNKAMDRRDFLKWMGLFTVSAGLVQILPVRTDFTAHGVKISGPLHWLVDAKTSGNLRILRKKSIFGTTFVFLPVDSKPATVRLVMASGILLSKFSVHPYRFGE